MSTVKPFVEKQIPKEKEIAAKEGKLEKLETKEFKDQKDIKEHKDSKEHKDKLEKEQKERKEKLEKEHKEKVEKHEKPEKEPHKEKEHLEKQIPIEKQLPVESSQPQVGFDPGMAGGEMVDPQAAALPKIFDKFTDKIWIVEKIHRDKLFKLEKNEIAELQTGFNVGDIPDPAMVSQRLAAIESTLAQLMHFIPQEARPDLSTGALKNEEQESTKKDESTPPPSKEADKGRKA